MREGGRAREIETEREGDRDRERMKRQQASFCRFILQKASGGWHWDRMKSGASLGSCLWGSQAPDASSVAFPRPPAGAGLATEQPAFLLASLQEANVSGHLLSLLYSLYFSLPLQNALCRTSKLDLWGIFLMLVMKWFLFKVWVKFLCKCGRSSILRFIDTPSGWVANIPFGTQHFCLSVVWDFFSYK